MEEVLLNQDGVNVVLAHLDEIVPEPSSPVKLHEVPPQPIQDVPIRTVQDYSLSLKDKRDVVFQRSLEQMNQFGEGQVHTLPPMRAVLAYIASLEDQPEWFKSSQAAIVNAQNLKFPQMDVVTRGYIADFLRQPREGERYCGKTKCISEHMSNGTIRCREFILPSQTDLAPHPGWCVLCHFHATNKAYLKNLSKSAGDVDPKELMLPIHTFIVQVDVVGEYRLDKTLMGDSVCVGIYGPFPIFNVNFYAQKEFPGHLKGWVESDDLVFRLSRTA